MSTVSNLMVSLGMNTAQIAQDVQKVKSLLGSMHSEVEKSSTSMVDKINKGWIGMTMKIYMAEKAIRMLSNAFGTLYQPVEEFNLSVTAMAAQITNMMVKQPGVDLAQQYQEARQYATDLAYAMEKIDAETLASAKDLRSMNEVMIANGVALDVYNQAQLDSFKNIANAVAVVASLSPNKEIQVRQEIGALLRGEVKLGDQLARQIQGMVDGPLEEEVKKHKQAGDLIEWLGELLKGYSAASQDIEATWAAIGTSLKTTWDIIARTGFSRGYQEINSILKGMNDWLRKNGDTISTVINAGWELMVGIGRVAVDVVIIFKNELLLAADASLLLLKGLTKIVEALPNIATGVKNIKDWIVEAAMAQYYKFTLEEDKWREHAIKADAAMWAERQELNKNYFTVLQQRIDNARNPPDYSAYDIEGWGGGALKGTVPKLGAGYQKDDAAKKKESEYKTMREALDRYADSVAKTNPLLNDFDKTLWKISDDAEDVARKLNDMTHLTEEQWLAFSHNILATEMQAIAYAELSRQMEIDKIAEEGLQKELQKEKETRLSIIDIIARQAKGKADISAESASRKVREEEKYGIKNKGDVATVEFENRQKLLNIMKEEYEQKLALAETDEELKGMMQEGTDIQTALNASVQEYIDIMGSYDVAMSIWSQEHEALKGFAEAWGLTQAEMITGTVDLWTDMGDLVTDISQQMAGTLTNVLSGLIEGTVDVKKAMTSLVSSILSSIVGMLIKVGMQYLITAIIGRGIQAAATAASVASGLSIAAAMTPAAIMTSIATFGAADVAGAAAFMAALGTMGAASTTLISMFAGLATGSLGGIALAEGGLINERVIGKGTTSGKLYEIGEAGPEYVVPANKMGGSGGVTIVINGDVLNSHDELARKIIPALRKAQADGVR